MDRIAFLTGFIQSNPDDLFSKHALALEWIKQGDDQNALELFHEIFSKDPLYVGSYYHMAKLQERKQDLQAAMETYTLGIKAAESIHDQHALRELRSAMQQLTDEMEGY
jgi:tetratricopeptide (TPR) repeat protein